VCERERERRRERGRGERQKDWEIDGKETERRWR